jgi:hypothetical protein
VCVCVCVCVCVSPKNLGVEFAIVHFGGRVCNSSFRVGEIGGEENKK